MKKTKILNCLIFTLFFMFSTIFSTMEAKALVNRSSVEIVGGIVYRGTHNDGTNYTITINSAKRETKIQQPGYNYIFTFDVTINNPVNDNLTITYTIQRNDANKLANNSNSLLWTDYFRYIVMNKNGEYSITSSKPNSDDYPLIAEISNQSSVMKFENDFMHCSGDLVKAGDKTDKLPYQVCVKRVHGDYFLIKKENGIETAFDYQSAYSGNWNDEDTYKGNSYVKPMQFYFNPDNSGIFDTEGLYVYFYKQQTGFNPDSNWQDYYVSGLDLTDEEYQEDTALELEEELSTQYLDLGKCLINNGINSKYQTQCDTYLTNRTPIAGMTEEELENLNISNYAKCVLEKENSIFMDDINTYCSSEYQNLSAEKDSLKDYVQSTGNEELMNKYAIEYGFDFNFEITDGCASLGSLMGIIKDIYNLIFYILCAVLALITMFDYAKAVVDNEEFKNFKKAHKHFAVRIAVVAIVWLLPSLVEFIFNLIGLGEYFCW